jgi:hypothetical protein
MATVRESVSMRTSNYVPVTSTGSGKSGDISMLFPSPALFQFVKRRVAQTDAYHGEEKRGESRCLLVMPVVVQAVDAQFLPLDEAQAMVIADVSPSGLGLIHERRFIHTRIVVHLSYPEEGKLLAAEVRWTKPLGPFYHLGCEVIGPLTVEQAQRFEPR